MHISRVHLISLSYPLMLISAYLKNKKKGRKFCSPFTNNISSESQKYLTIMCKIHARLGKSQLYNLHISYIKGPDVLFLKYNVVIDRQELKPMSNRVKKSLNY